MLRKFTIEDVREFWNKNIRQYEFYNERIKDIHHQRFWVTLEYFQPRPQDKVLNIWSRTGAAIPYLKKKQPRIKLYNLEVSPEMIKIAKKKYPQEYFIKTDLVNLEFPDNFFDWVISLETLEHAPEPDKFLRELSRVMKINGFLILSTPTAFHEPTLWLYNKLCGGHGEGPHRFYSTLRVKKMLTENGFTFLDHKSTLIMPVGPIWWQDFWNKLLARFHFWPLTELGIRQFYLCRK